MVTRQGGWQEAKVQDQPLGEVVLLQAAGEPQEHGRVPREVHQRAQGQESGRHDVRALPGGGGGGGVEGGREVVELLHCHLVKSVITV